MKKYLLRRKYSIELAWSGLYRFFKSEPHASIHLIAAIIVILLAWVLSVTRMEWIALIIAIALVVQTEILNTVLEKVMDFIHPDLNPRVKIIKDMAAASVLWSSIIALVIGCVIFLPYLTQWIRG